MTVDENNGEGNDSNTTGDSEDCGKRSVYVVPFDLCFLTVMVK